MMKILKSKKGFTLIELLIVMAIIAILIGISLPRFKGMQDEGTKTKARAGLATLRTAVEAYAASPRSNGVTKYPDGTDIGGQRSWNAPRNAGTGWEVMHLTRDRTAVATGTTGPVMLSSELIDPFANNLEFDYYVNLNGFYVIWSNGPARVNVNCTISNTGVVTADARAVYVSNGTPQSN